MYYRCLLDADATVNPDLPAKHYKALVDGVAVPAPPSILALEDMDRDYPIEVCHAIEAPVPVADGWDVTVAYDERPTVVRRAGHLAAVARHVGGDGVADGLPSDEPSDGAGHGDDGGAIDPMDVPVEVYRPPHAQMIYGPTVEGVKIESTTFRDATHCYARWSVDCPLRFCQHKTDSTYKCQKSRNTMHEQTKHFGIAEVYGFLGLWVKTANKYPGKHSHLTTFKPTVDEIRAYCVEHGMF